MFISVLGDDLADGDGHKPNKKYDVKPETNGYIVIFRCIFIFC